MMGEHGDRLDRKTVGARSSRKCRLWVRVMLTGDMGENGDNRASVRAQRKASTWRQKPSAASPYHLWLPAAVWMEGQVSRSRTASEYPLHCLPPPPLQPPSPVSPGETTPLSGVFLTP